MYKINFLSQKNQTKPKSDEKVKKLKKLIKQASVAVQKPKSKVFRTVKERHDTIGSDAKLFEERRTGRVLRHDA